MDGACLSSMRFCGDLPQGRSARTHANAESEYLRVGPLASGVLRSIQMCAPAGRRFLMSRSVSSTTMPVLRAVYTSDPSRGSRSMTFRTCEARASALAACHKEYIHTRANAPPIKLQVGPHRMGEPAKPAGCPTHRVRGRGRHQRPLQLAMLHEQACGHRLWQREARGYRLSQQLP